MVTPPFVVEALTYEPQCLPRLSTRYEVMGSPSVLDKARHCRPAELDVKLVHGTWAQMECYFPLLWTVLRHSPPRCEGISPGPLSRETGHMISCCFGHAQLASMLIYKIPNFSQHSQYLGIPNPFSLVFKKLCLLSQASLLGSFQQMFLALLVCCRYPDVVL